MESGLDKCAKASYLRGTLEKTANRNLDVDTIIRELDPGDSYEYLGVHECNGIHHSAMKEKVRKEYLQKNQISTKDRAQFQKPYCGNKHTSCPCCSIQP